MSNLNYKNHLQEYFQKQHMELPKYVARKVSGPAHCPVWQSEVKLYNGSTYIGDTNITKSVAEISAAEKALKALKLIPDTESYSADLNLIEKFKLDINPILSKPLKSAVPKTLLLVDVENMHNFIDDVVREISGLNIYAFVGEHHHLATKIFPTGVIKIISPSAHSDGTDTCMQVYIGFLLGSGCKDYENYLIATRDHYGSALVDMITCKLQGDIKTWNPKYAKVVTQISHIPTL